MDLSVPVVTDGAERADRGGGVGDDAPPAAMSHGSPARTVRSVRAPALLAELICDMIRDRARGHRRSLNMVCEEIGVDPRHASAWLLGDENFRKNYELARCQRHDDVLEECLEIADDKSQDDIIDDKGYRRPNKEWIARSRVRIQTRLDLLARWDPRRFGAKLELNAEINSRSLNLHFDGGDVAAAHSYADLMRGRTPG